MKQRPSRIVAQVANLDFQEFIHTQAPLFCSKPHHMKVAFSRSLPGEPWKQALASGNPATLGDSSAGNAPPPLAFP